MPIGILLIQREFAADFRNHGFDLVGGTLEVPGGQRHTAGNFLHFRLAQSTGGDGGSADADAAGDGGLLGVIGNGVFVQGDMV